MSNDHASTTSTRWRTPGLLLAAVLLYVAGPIAAPSGLRNLYELDADLDKYVAVASDVAAYQWANVVAGAAAVLGALGVHLQMASWRARPAAASRMAATGLLISAGGWAAIALVRATVVASTARDLADDRTVGSNGLADLALRGDGPFIVFAVIAAIALMALAVVGRRADEVGRVTAGLIILGGLTTGALVRSDPLAIVFIPPFPFVLAFLPLAVVSLRRARSEHQPVASRSRPAQGRRLADTSAWPWMEARRVQRGRQ